MVLNDKQIQLVEEEFCLVGNSKTTAKVVPTVMLPDDCRLSSAARPTTTMVLSHLEYIHWQGEPVCRLLTTIPISLPSRHPFASVICQANTYGICPAAAGMAVARGK